MQEETKKKAVIVKHKYMGPIVKLRSTRRLLPGQVVPGEEEAQLAAGGGATTPAGAGKDRKVGSRNKDGTEDGADGNKDGGSEDGKGKEGKKEDDLEYEGLVSQSWVGPECTACCDWSIYICFKHLIMLANVTVSNLCGGDCHSSFMQHASHTHASQWPLMEV